MTAPAIRRHAFVGTGHRAEMYVRALLDTHADVGTPVAWCDTNPVRMRYYDRVFQEYGPQAPLPDSWAADDFDDMLSSVEPDAVVITTPDYRHSDYLVRALDRGIDAIVEKPLTTDAERARAIAAAAGRSDAHVTMAFNYRYSPRNTLVRELIAGGAIGTVTSVHFEWLLDTGHGADYFRRWHGEKDKSGGLIIHKASHHFDLVNWWVDDVPATVSALGSRRFYGGENARARGENPVARTSRDLPLDDPFRIDLNADERLRQLYLEAEHIDGYQRDRNVFGDQITIEDTMNVLVGYRNGVALTYSLYAYAPWEGYRVAINGTEGRIELDVTERPHRAKDDVEVDPSAAADRDRPEPAAEVRSRGSQLRLQRHWERAREVPIPVGKGGHGGGDARLLDDIFRGDGPDPLAHRASWRDGLRSAAIGIAANESMSTGSTVSIGSLDLPLD